MLAVNASFFDTATYALWSNVAQGGRILGRTDGPHPYLAMKGNKAWFGRGVVKAMEVDWAAGAGPMLLEGGKKAAIPEKYGPDVYPGGETIKNQRMAVGIAGGRLCFVTLWGTFEDLRKELLACGCVDAMNLDGGGSAQWVEGGKTIIGADKSGYIRPVANALVAMKAEVIPVQVRQQLLQMGKEHNRPGTALNPQGLIIHETATQNASAAAEAAYFASADRAASAHYFVDDREAVMIIPENEQAQHAGPTANARFLSIEMCHFDDTRFAATWHNAVELAADICHRHGWTAGPNIYSHKWVSQQWPKETNHTDPYSYFAAHGKTFQDFCDDVDATLKVMPAPAADQTTALHQQIADLTKAMADRDAVIRQHLDTIGTLSEENADLCSRIDAVKMLVASWK